MSRTGIQLCYPFEEKRLLKWRPPYIVQPKLDGDRMRAELWDTTDGYINLFSSEANQMNSALPHIADYLNKLTFRFPSLRYLELDGEAYTHGMNHELVHGIASRRVNPHSRLEDLEYWIFDVVENCSMAERIDLLLNLSEIFKQVPGPCHVVPFEVAETLDDVLRIYDKFVNQGYEGIIVRDHEASYVRKRSTRVMKWKPKKEDYYVIVGTEEEISIEGQPKNSLGALICRANEGENLFNVGTGFSADARRDLWARRAELPGKIVKVAYQHITSGRGVPRFPVFCEIVWDLSSKPIE